jgi:CheY-like chemotaxis protein
VKWKIANLRSAECDPILIKQVFQNLIANALKFTRTREHAVIEISQRQENGETVIFVSDNGVGFNMKYKDKLYSESFSACIGPRISKARASAWPRYNASFASTEDGSGRRPNWIRARRFIFTVRWTEVRKRSEEQDGCIRSLHMNSNEVDILLVDDSQDDVDLTLHALRAENLANRVFIARDGEEALDFLFCTGPHSTAPLSIRPSWCLLDLKMPKVDGVQVLKQIKGDPRTRSIPVVLMTSSREEKDMVTGYEAGRQQLYPETGGLRRVPERW